MQRVMEKAPTTSMCCCFELKTGSLILAWLDLIVSAIVTILIVFAVIAISSAQVKPVETADDGSTLPEVPPEYESVGFVAMVFLFINIILFPVILVCAAYFIRGVDKKSSKMCRYYVIVTAVVIAVHFLEGLITLNIFMILLCVLKTYYFIVINSLYKVYLYDEEHGDFGAQQHVSHAGYEQYYEPENNTGYNGQGNQANKFEGP